MDTDFQVNWENFCAEQTPENLRIDKKTTRAWGYRRFTLANLLRFSRRCKACVAIHSPFITVRPVEDYNSDTSDGDCSAFWAGDKAKDHIDSGNTCKGITTRVVSRMKNSIGASKTSKCMRAAKAFEDVPPGKLSFRYTAPVGANGPVCLMFRITNYTLGHECLERLNNSEGCKTVIVTLSDNMVILKLVMR